MSTGDYHRVCDKVLCLLIEHGSVLKLVGEVVESGDRLGPTKATEALSGVVENLNGAARHRNGPSSWYLFIIQIARIVFLRRIPGPLEELCDPRLLPFRLSVSVVCMFSQV